MMLIIIYWNSSMVPKSALQGLIGSNSAYRAWSAIPPNILLALWPSGTSPHIFNLCRESLNLKKCPQAVRLPRDLQFVYRSAPSFANILHTYTEIKLLVITYQSVAGAGCDSFWSYNVACSKRLIMLYCIYREWISPCFWRKQRVMIWRSISPQTN